MNATFLNDNGRGAEKKLLWLLVVGSLALHVIAVAVMNRYGLAKPGRRIVTINMVAADRAAKEKAKPKPPQAASGGGGGGQTAPTQTQAAPAQAAPPSAAAQAQHVEAVRKAVSKKGLLGVMNRQSFGASSRASNLDRVGAAGGNWGSGVGTGAGTGTGTGSADGWGGQAVDTKGAYVAEEKKVAAATPRVAKLAERKDEKIQSAEAAPQEDLSMKEAVAVIKRTVDTYLGGLRYMYNKELRKNPGLEGKVTIAITITPEGAVNEAKVTESTMNAPEFEQAIVGRIRHWTFPPVAPKKLTVTYPFVFFPTM